MKTLLSYFSIFAIMCFIGNFAINYSLGQQLNKQSPYHLAFASIGANSLESQLDSWAKIKTNSSAEEINFYMQTILKALNLSSDKQNIVTKDEQNNLIFNYENKHNNETFQITILSDQQKNETAIMVNISGKAKTDNIPRYTAKLDEILGFNWSHYYAYTSILHVVLSQESQQEFLEVMLNNLAAQNIEFYQDQRLVMATGYSSMLPADLKAISPDGKKYNIQAAMKSLPAEEKTYIYLGVPLILNNL